MPDGFNRALSPVLGSPNEGMTLIAGHWAIGATGAVGTQTRAKGLTLTRDNVGLYTLQLTNAGAVACAIPVIAYANAMLLPASGDVDPTNDTDAVRVRVVTAVNTTGVITIALTDEGDVVREAANGARLMVFVALYDSGNI